MALSLIISVALINSGASIGGTLSTTARALPQDSPQVNDRVKLKLSSKSNILDATISTFAVERLADAESLILMPRVASAVFDLRSRHLVNRANDLIIASIRLRREIEFMGDFTLEQSLKKMEAKMKASDMEIEVTRLKGVLELRQLRIEEYASPLLSLPILSMKGVMEEDKDHDGDAPSTDLVFLEKHANEALARLAKVKLASIPSEAVLKCISFHNPLAPPAVMKLIGNDDLQDFRLARVKVLTGPRKGLEAFVSIHAITFDCPDVGQLGYIHSSSVAAFEDDALLKYRMADESGDQATCADLLQRRRVFRVTRGDQVEIVTMGDVAKIRMLSGKLKDKIIYIDRRALSRYRLSPI